jgi:hypothetical protein
MPWCTFDELLDVRPTIDSLLGGFEDIIKLLLQRSWF